MNATILDVAADGNVRCLWNETIPLESIGRLTITRASTVEFNDDSQVWEVRFPDAPDIVAFSNQSRQACLDWEHDEVNRRL